MAFVTKEDGVFVAGEEAIPVFLETESSVSVEDESTGTSSKVSGPFSLMGSQSDFSQRYPVGHWEQGVPS